MTRITSGALEITWHESDNIYATAWEIREVSLVQGRHLQLDQVPTLYIRCRNQLFVWSNCTWQTVNCLNVNNAAMLPKKLCVRKSHSHPRSLKESLESSKWKHMCWMQSKGSFTGISCGDCYFVTKPLRRCQYKVSQKFVCACVRVCVCVGGVGGHPTLAGSEVP